MAKWYHLGEYIFTYWRMAAGIRYNHFMKIVTYDDVDPISVLQLTMLALDFQLTPEHAAHIRRTDPRPFPCFTVCAVEDDMAIGLVGIFRLPMITLDGREDVGGVWAVSTHPQFTGRGVATSLLDEAHTRMRAAGLRFSSLGTSRYRSAYKLYQRHGYEDLHPWATAQARWETAQGSTPLRALPVGPEGYESVEKVFAGAAQGRLGFSWRYTPFARMRDAVRLEDIWILWENGQPVGYALAQVNQSTLIISDVLLPETIQASQAVAAVAAKVKADFLRISVSRPSDVASLERAGYQIAYQDWSAFMLKPLVPEVTIEDARRLFGIGTDRFLISWLDVT